MRHHGAPPKEHHRPTHCTSCQLPWGPSTRRDDIGHESDGEIKAITSKPRSNTMDQRAQTNKRTRRPGPATHRAGPDPRGHGGRGKKLNARHLNDMHPGRTVDTAYRVSKKYFRSTIIESPSPRHNHQYITTDASKGAREFTTATMHGHA